MVINKKVQKGIAKSVKILGFEAVSKDIRKAKTKQQVVKNVNFIIKNNKCSKTLFDPVSNKIINNNKGYQNCKKFNKQLKRATEFL